MDAEDRRAHGLAEQRLVALVVGVGDQGDAGRDQLGPGGLDVDAAGVLGAGDPAEPDAVEGPRPLAVLELGLGHGRAERDVPQGGALRDVRLAAREIAQEPALRGGAGGVVDRRVGERPVDREPEVAPELLEGLLVLLGEPLAQLDEVAPGDVDLALGVGLGGWLEAGVVGQGGVAAHAEVVLHAPLGGQAVVVPAHGVEDLTAAHALEAGDRVGVGVGEDMADMQGSGHGGRGRVDRVDLVPRLRPVEPVGALGVPAAYPYRLEPIEGGLVGNGGMAQSLFGHGALWYGVAVPTGTRD